jgi:hypothetical protein
VIKPFENNYLALGLRCHNLVTVLSSPVTNFVTVVTAIFALLSQKTFHETRAIAGFAAGCDKSDSCDSCKATSPISLF